jgi:hypothetical protein
VNNAVIAKTKDCPKCGKSKSWFDFTIRATGKRANQPVAWCKECSSLEQKKRKERDKSLYRRVEWPSKLKRLYGLSVDQYFEILANQDGGCAICKTKTPGNRKTMFSVDHSHQTGQIRGLLCDPCNTALGLLQDDQNRLQNAMEYLAKAEGESCE